jgi:hypothetical protein
LRNPPEKPGFSEIEYSRKKHAVLKFRQLQPKWDVVHEQALQDFTSPKCPHHKGLSHSTVLKKDSFTTVYKSTTICRFFSNIGLFKCYALMRGLENSDLGTLNIVQRSLVKNFSMYGKLCVCNMVLLKRKFSKNIY